MGSSISNSIALATEKIVGDINIPPVQEHIIVSEGIEKYIETPCLEAIKKLWSLNIATFESSGNEHGGWIAILSSELSEENKQIFNDLVDNNIEGYSSEITYKESSGIYVLGAETSEEVSKKLLELASIFKMQDTRIGIMSQEDFLARICGCATHKILDDGTIEFVFSPQKMEKSFEEYVKEKKAIYIPRENTVYLNEYYYTKHMNYLKYLEKLNFINALKRVRGQVNLPVDDDKYISR